MKKKSTVVKRGRQAKRKSTPRPRNVDGRAVLLEASAKVGDPEVEEVLREAKKIESKSKIGPLAQFFEDIRDMIAMVRDYARGSYREIPFGTIAAIVGALLYVLAPVDLIPDFIPGVGYVDDAAVVAACLKLVKEDIEEYRRQKKA